MTFFVKTWNMGEGSKHLADSLGVKRIRNRGSTFRPSPRHTILNWGCTELPASYNVCRIINLPGAVANVVDKRRFFQLYSHEAGFNVPEYFFDKAEATAWLAADPRRTLVCRTVLRGHEGRGIVLAENPADVPDAPLYTAYVKKKAEYRVHVFGNEAIDYVQKKRKLGHAEGDSRIRNTANGYVFARDGVIPPQSVLDNAVRAVQWYSLDFGAVDVVYNEYQDKAYVLEINTAPGIQGQTVGNYANAIRRLNID